MTTLESEARTDPSAARRVETCLGCGASGLGPVLDLGPQPLANNLVSPADAPPTDLVFPLGIQCCGACHLVQLTHLVDPSLMFASYLYVPSTSTTWVEHCDELAADVRERGNLGADDFLVEIGSNDGTLLRAFRHQGQRVLGVDPAANIAAQANAAGLPTLNRFFGPATAEEILRDYGPARAVVSTNVLAHVPDPVGVLRGVRALLAPGGIYVNESPSLKEMVLHNEFDTIYHEHVSYLSLHALENLFKAARLRLVDALPQTVHGGTLRVVGVADTDPRRPSALLAELMSAERAAGVLDAEGLRDFATRTADIGSRLRGLVAQLRSEGRRVAAYGATAKGNTLLGYARLSRQEVEYIADRNTLKQGLLTPGLRIPIVSPEQLAADPPDVLLLLAWNLADEIRRQLAWFAERGGQFLVPVPEPRLVS